LKLLIIGNVGLDLMAPYLRARDIEIVLADATVNGLNAQLADRVYLLDPDSWEPLAELALTEKVDGVTSISGPDHRNLRDSLLKEYLETHHSIPTLANPPTAAAIAVNKAETKKWLSARGFPVAEGHTAADPKEALEIAERLGFPVAVKNLCDSGGIGLQIIDSASKLRRLPPRDFPCLIEKFVWGAEFSVEVLNFNGRALPLMPIYKGPTNLDAIHPMERVRLVPAPLDPVDSARLRRLAKAIVADLNLQPTADVDIVWGKDGPQVLEINPRFGGVTALSIAASGVMVYWALVDMIMGDWDPMHYRFNRGLAADLPIRPGAADIPLDDLLASDGIFRIKLQKLKTTIGRIALIADNPQQLLEIADRAIRLHVCEETVLHELENLIEIASA
jgi:carbamoylphosphate synthase large subunit